MCISKHSHIFLFQDLYLLKLPKMSFMSYFGGKNYHVEAFFFRAFL